MLDYYKAISEEGINTISQSNIAVLYGSQEVLMEEILQKILDVLIEESFREFDYIILNIDSLKGEKEQNEKPVEASDIIEQVETFPFGSGKKIVSVRNIEKLPIDQRNYMALYLRNIPSTSLLVLMVNGKEKSSLSSLVGTKLEKTLSSRAAVVNCSMKTNDIIKWVIQKTAMITGKVIGEEECKYLLKRSGSDLRNITNELEKLSAFVEPNFRITRESIDLCCHPQEQSVVFDLTEALEMGQTSRAMSIFSDLMKQQEEPLRLLALLSSHFNLIRQVRELKERRIPPREIVSLFQGLGEHPFRVQKAMDIRNFSLDGLKKAHRWLLEADMSIKTGRQEPEIVLEMLVILLCQEATRRKSRKG